MTPIIDRKLWLNKLGKGHQHSSRVVVLAMILVAGLMVGAIAGLMVQIGSTGGPRLPEPFARTPLGILYVTHSPIYISGNAEFTLSNGVSSGTGAASDPYIIADWDINASTATGIYIENTDAHFTVRNCYIHYGASYNDDGIDLDNCVNGTLQNNICSDDVAGIYLILSSNNTVINNTCLGSLTNGISTYSSSNNTLFNNTCSSNKVYGMFISQSSNNNTIDSNNCSSNTNNGIFLYASSNNTLVNNNCSSNDQRGIYLDAESHDTLSSNNVSGNAAEGIYIDSSSNNVVTWNQLYDNSGIGVIIAPGSSSNLITHNTFIGNNGAGSTYDSIHIQAWADETSNWWNSTDGHGNYWSDWTTPDANHDGIVDLPYVIGGGTGAKDHYPLTTVQQIPEVGTMPLVAIVLLAMIVLTTEGKRRKAY